MSTRDMAAEALNGGIRIPSYDGSNPMEVLYAERAAFDRRMHAFRYPPQQVTEPAAVSVSITATSFGGEITVHDARTMED